MTPADAGPETTAPPLAYLPPASPFQTKYTQKNGIARRMVEGFFDAVGAAVSTACSSGDVVSALEVGCGEGVSTGRIRHMLPPSVTLEAGDVNLQRLAAARTRNPDVPIGEESVYQLPRADRSFDLVFILEVLEHLQDPARALDEVCRVSRRWVICSVPREPLWRGLNLLRLKYVTGLGNTPGHVNHWSKRTFTDFVGRRLDVRRRLSPIPWTVIVGEVRR